MDLQLTNKRILVTGSSTGIGEGIAKTLAQEGATVIVHGRNEQKAKQVQNEILSSGGKACIAIGDLATDVGAKQAYQMVADAVDAVDVLVNNAATYEARQWSEVTPDQWLETLNSNVVSVVRMVHHFVPMMKSSKWGRIINIASSVATQPFPAMPDYSASKAAILNLTVSLAKELDKTGITVNTLGVGIVRTPHLESYFHKVGKEQGWNLDWESIEQQVLTGWMDNRVGRLGEAADVANLVAYLSSPLSGYINGTNIRVDGGSTVTVN
jgi:NAD(P)-dependent dehydrogenase (short-subunit alcohol dehydrogenase family)